jgi:phosphoribosylanthranilate isomerase
MVTMTRVKICGIRSTDMAQLACDAGADAIGLVFYPASPRAVTAEEAVVIAAVCAPLVSVVGLFVNADRAEVEAVLNVCPLDLLQFHGDESAEYCEQFARPYIKAVSMRPDVDVASLMDRHPRARAFLFDAWRPGVPGGTGETFAWERLPAMDRPWLLAGGLTPENVAGAVRQLRPPAVDVSGGVEHARGEKNPALLRQFVAAVREADQCKDEEVAA